MAQNEEPVIGSTVVIGQTADGINIIRKFTGYNFGLETWLQYPEYIKLILDN